MIPLQEASSISPPLPHYFHHFHLSTNNCSGTLGNCYHLHYTIVHIINHDANNLLHRHIPSVPNCHHDHPSNATQYLASCNLNSDCYFYSFSNLLLY